MPRPRAIAPALAVLAALALAACTPGGPVATPTPTALTEEQAYAAAEDAFRAYIDALNQIDVAQPTTFEPAFALSTGELNSFDRQQYSQWHANGWVKDGDAVVSSMSPATNSTVTQGVKLEICLDVSAVTLIDSSGKSQVGSDRPPVQPLYATVAESTSGRWQVSELVGRADGTPC